MYSRVYELSVSAFTSQLAVIREEGDRVSVMA